MSSDDADKPDRHPRYRVHLEVRFQVARDFVVEYAENLSKGGLFIRGAQELEPLQEVEIQMDLPGMGSFSVTGRVAHIMDTETATRYQRKPGAGLQIIEAPPDFEAALGSYLVRLGRRRDVLVLATDQECVALLGNAGYQVELAAEPDELVAQIARSEHPVIGVVVLRSQEQAYRSAAAAAGADPLVHAIDYLEELELLLEDLDDEL